LKAVIKPQYVDQIAKAKGVVGITVDEMLAKKCDRDNKDQVIAALGNIIIYVEAN
jgi:translation initiation factor RLI1